MRYCYITKDNQNTVLANDDNNIANNRTLQFLLCTDFSYLKGVFAKNKRGYRLTAKNKRFSLLLILLLSVASIRRKLLNRLIPKNV